MNLHHLRVFYEVARAGSFTGAAARLHVSQPAVSALVRQLEESVGLPLVDVEKRKTRLTAAGVELAEYAARLLAVAREAEQRMRAIKGVEAGDLRVSASSTPGAYLLPRILRAFRDRFPQVEVHLEIGNSDGTARLILSGEADLGVVGAPAGHADLQAVPIGVDRFIAVVAPEHHLAGRHGLTRANLSGESWLLRESGSATRRLTEEALGPLKGMELGGVEATKTAAAAGLGIAIVSSLAVELERAAGVLVELDLPWLAIRRELWLVSHRQRRLSPAAGALVSLIRNQAPPGNV